MRSESLPSSSCNTTTSDYTVRLATSLHVTCLKADNRRSMPSVIAGSKQLANIEPSSARLRAQRAILQILDRMIGKRWEATRRRIDAEGKCAGRSGTARCVWRIQLAFGHHAINPGGSGAGPHHKRTSLESLFSKRDTNTQSATHAGPKQLDSPLKRVFSTTTVARTTI